jgi:hypothetical protein
MTNNWYFALIDWITEHLLFPALKKLAWQIGGFIGRRRSGRAMGHNQWRSFLMGLSTYLWHKERSLYTRWYYNQLAKRQAAEFFKHVNITANDTHPLNPQREVNIGLLRAWEDQQRRQQS